jgi:hypothetical protein
LSGTFGPPPSLLLWGKLSWCSNELLKQQSPPITTSTGYSSSLSDSNNKILKRKSGTETTGPESRNAEMNKKGAEGLFIDQHAS